MTAHSQLGLGSKEKWEHSTALRRWAEYNRKHRYVGWATFVAFVQDAKDRIETVPEGVQQ